MIIFLKVIKSQNLHLSDEGLFMSTEVILRNQIQVVESIKSYFLQCSESNSIQSNL